MEVGHTDQNADKSGGTTQELALGGGTVTLYLPKAWKLIRKELFEAVLDVTWVEGARLVVELRTYEDPEAIRTNALESFLTGPDRPPLDEDGLVHDENGVPDYELTRAEFSCTAEAGGPAGLRVACWAWRRLGLLRPNHARTVDVQLYVPEQDAGSREAEAARSFLDRITTYRLFADRETAADRVGPGRTLLTHALWDCVYLRLPSDWPEPAREGDDDHGGKYVVRDERSKRWALEIEYRPVADEEGYALDVDYADFARRIAEAFRDEPSMSNVQLDLLPEPRREAVIKIEFQRVEDGVELHRIWWQKIVDTGRVIVLGHFHWAVPAAAVNDSDIVALTALLDRECRNAVLQEPFTADESSCPAAPESGGAPAPRPARGLGFWRRWFSPRRPGSPGSA